MMQRLRFCAAYFVFWMGYFAVLRLAFLLYHHAAAAGAGTIAGTFLYGARMDMAATAFPSVIVFGLTAVSVFLPRLAGRAILAFSVCLLVLIALLATIDLELFRNWGFRIDGAVLQYLNTPHEALASAGASPITLLVVLFLVFSAAVVFGFLKVLWPGVRTWAPVRLPANLLSFILLSGLAGALYYPAKGGFQDMPMTQSTVYFSHDNFANQAAVNVAWNFFDSIWWQTYRKDNPYRYLPPEEAQRVSDSLLAGSRTPAARWLTTTRPNVIIIIWESFSSKVVARLGGVKGVTPNVDSLSRQGILFDHFYATGDRSPEGLTGILSGYPAQPTTEIIQHPRKSGSLPALPRDLKPMGYYRVFYYGGDPEFTNFKSYALQAGFDSLVTKDAFDPRDRHSSWGADDHVVLGRLLTDAARLPRPFFVTLFTLSSHEPFAVPMDPVFPGLDERSRFLNAHAYTDRSIGAFIRKAQTQPWWDSTLVVIMADHGHRLPMIDSLQPSRRWELFSTPMLWLGGALTVRDTVVHRLGGQTDFARTLLDQMGLDASAYRWSRDLLAPGGKSWAWFTFTDGFGWVNDAGGRMTWDNVGRRAIRQEGKIGAKDFRAGQAMLQSLIEDYVSR